jgi:hypothetical protein
VDLDFEVTHLMAPIMVYYKIPSNNCTISIVCPGPGAIFLAVHAPMLQLCYNFLIKQQFTNCTGRKISRGYPMLCREKKDPNKGKMPPIPHRRFGVLSPAF